MPCFKQIFCEIIGFCRITFEGLQWLHLYLVGMCYVKTWVMLDFLCKQFIIDKVMPLYIQTSKFSYLLLLLLICYYLQKELDCLFFLYVNRKIIIYNNNLLSTLKAYFCPWYLFVNLPSGICFPVSAQLLFNDWHQVKGASMGFRDILV